MAIVLPACCMGNRSKKFKEKSKTNLKVAVFSHIGEVQTISGMMKAAVEDAKARGWTVETFDGRGDMVAVNNQVNSFQDRHKFLLQIRNAIVK